MSRINLSKCVSWAVSLPLQELRAEYGSDPIGFYATDAFNENVPPSDDPDFLQASSAAVFGVSVDTAFCGSRFP